MSEREKKRILLVDDEPDFVKVASRRLEAAGYEVVTALDGEKGLKIARAEEPDLILLDVALPGLDGYKVCKKLKEDGRTRGIPILLFTARAPNGVEREGSKCGADGYIYKPFDTKTLFEKIRSALEPTAKAIT